MHQFMPCLIRHHRGAELAAITLGHPLLDDYLAFVAARARTNTWLAVASDLKIFFGVVAKEPAQVNARMCSRSWPFSELRGWASGWCVWRTARRGWRRARSPGGCRACAACTRIWRPAATPASPATRFRPAWRRVAPALGAASGGVPLIRTPRTLPRVLSPAEVDALVGGAAHAPRPGHGRGDGAGWAATLRGAGLAARGRQRRASGACSSPRARAGGSGSCRYRRGSSRPWAAIWSRSGRRPRRPSGCSWC